MKENLKTLNRLRQRKIYMKCFILVNMFYTVKGSIIHNGINLCLMKGAINRLVSLNECVPNLDEKQE